jgi:hypothetical protein
MEIKMMMMMMMLMLMLRSFSVVKWKGGEKDNEISHFIPHAPQ